jgi:hypothetical protein
VREGRGWPQALPYTARCFCCTHSPQRPGASLLSHRPVSSWMVGWARKALGAQLCGGALGGDDGRSCKCHPDACHRDPSGGWFRARGSGVLGRSACASSSGEMGPGHKARDDSERVCLGMKRRSASSRVNAGACLGGETQHPPEQKVIPLPSGRSYHPLVRLARALGLELGDCGRRARVGQT